jgi:two-component system sensor histidine kinase KdpD
MPRRPRIGADLVGHLRLGTRPPGALGFTVSLLSVAAATAAIYPLKQIARVESLAVVYLPAVLLVSTIWGLWAGLGTSLLSSAAFNFFHLPPVGRFTISDSRNWVGLAAFTVVAVVASTISEVARSRAAEAERRRAEADLAASLARELLSGANTAQALGGAAHRLAVTLDLPSAAIELGAVVADERRRALPLRDADRTQIATLLVPRNLPVDITGRLGSRIVPTLEAIMAIALRRDQLQAEAVETAALRRSDDVKTALLRAVSHDLRTPLTAIVAAGHALASRSLTEQDRSELSEAVVDEGERLAGLVEKLLDLSRLQAGHAEPRRELVSVEELVLAAVQSSPLLGDVRVSIEPGVPELRADAAQLERAIANLLENATRFSDTIAVNARRSGDRVLVSVVDQGPGIDPAQRERIFEPFYRGPQARGGPWAGSGLGLAIAKGFVEAGGGTITVDSLPGQGTTFVIALPLDVSTVAEPTPEPEPERA